VNCINCNPVPRGTRNHLHEVLWNSGLTSADSGLQLDLEIALNGVSAKVTAYSAVRKSELKLSDYEIEGSLTRTPTAVYRTLVYQARPYTFATLCSAFGL